MNNVKSHETKLVSEKNASDVDAILEGVENVPFALSGASTKTILYALFSVIAALELTAALGFYTASLGVGVIVAMVLCGLVAFMFHGLLHSILSNTAHGIVFKKRSESKAMSAEVVANIVLSIVLLLIAACTVFFVGKQGFTAYRATAFEAKNVAVTVEKDGITADMLTDEKGKISNGKLKLLGKLEGAKTAHKQAETTASDAEKERYDKTTTTIVGIVGASAFVLELLLALLAFTIATAKKAAAIDEIVKRSNMPVVTQKQAISTNNEPITILNPIVTQHRNDSQTFETLPKPSENRTIIKGFERNEAVPITPTNDTKKVPCGHCKDHFTQKNARHKYCSDPCRLTAWQAKNGVTVYGTK